MATAKLIIDTSDTQATIDVITAARQRMPATTREAFTRAIMDLTAARKAFDVYIEPSAQGPVLATQASRALMELLRRYEIGADFAF